MSKASGSIDLKSLKVAGEANKYITAIDENGVKVHAANKVNLNYTQITSDGMEIFKEVLDSGGKPALDENDNPIKRSIARFGDNVRIGAEDGDRLEMTDAGLSFIGAVGDNQTIEGFAVNTDGPSLVTHVQLHPSFREAYNYPTSYEYLQPSTNSTITAHSGNVQFNVTLPWDWGNNITITSVVPSTTGAKATFTNSSSMASIILTMPYSTGLLTEQQNTINTSAIITFSDSHQETISYQITYDGATTWTMDITNAPNNLTHVKLLFPEAFYEGVVDKTTTLTAGTRVSSYAKGPFSAAIGQELKASENNHVALGAYNEDNLTQDGTLILSVGDGSAQDGRSNAFAVGKYNISDTIYPTIYVGLNQNNTESFGDGLLLYLLRYLSWVDYDSSTHTYSNPSGIHLLANYYDTSDEE